MTFFAAVFVLDGDSSATGDLPTVGNHKFRSATHWQTVVLERMLDHLALGDPDGRDGTDGWVRSEALPSGVFGGVTCEVPGPVAQGEGGGEVFLDGYIGNRRALAGELGMPGDAPTHSVLWRGYSKWGIDGLGERLRGDYVLVIRERREGRTWVLRDPLGVRPLYWTRLGNAVLMASSVAALFLAGAVGPAGGAGSVSAAMDPVFCALEIQACRHFDLRSTIYRDIRRLPGGSLFEFSGESGGTFGERVFWSFAYGERLVLAREEEYVERFVALLETAVKRCCETIHPLGLQLSGGLDSNLLLGVLGTLGLSDRLTVQSSLYPGWPMDESEYIRDAGRFHGVEIHAIDSHTEGSPEDWDAGMRRTRLPAYAPWMKPGNPGPNLRGHVVLNGEGGDEWFGGSHAYLAEDLLSGDWRALMSTLGSVDGLRRRAKMALGCLSRCSETGFRFQHWRRTRQNGDRQLIAAQMRRNPAYRQALRGPRRLRDFHSPVQRNLQDMYAPGWLAAAREGQALSNLASGQMARSPLNDLDLIAFSHSLPGRLKFGGELNKVLFRRLPHLLPPSILGRSDKAVFSGLYLSALRNPQVLQELREARLADLGCLQRPTLEHIVSQLEGGEIAPNDPVIVQVWPIWTISRIFDLTN